MGHVCEQSEGQRPADPRRAVEAGPSRASSGLTGRGNAAPLHRQVTCPLHISTEGLASRPLPCTAVSAVTGHVPDTCHSAQSLERGRHRLRPHGDKGHLPRTLPQRQRHAWGVARARPPPGAMGRVFVKSTPLPSAGARGEGLSGSRQRVQGAPPGGQVGGSTSGWRGRRRRPPRRPPQQGCSAAAGAMEPDSRRPRPRAGCASGAAPPGSPGASWAAQRCVRHRPSPRRGRRRCSHSSCAVT